MKKGITLGLVLCLCMVMLAGCGKQEQLQESEAAKTLVTTINEKNKNVSATDEYGFKEKERKMQNGELHEIYESNSVTLSSAMNKEDDNRELIKSTLEIISKEGEVTKIITSSKYSKEKSYAIGYTGPSVVIKQLYPDFDFKDNNEGMELMRTFYPKDKK